MRLFVAVNLKNRAQKLIYNKINIIKNEVSEDIKWVDRDKLHITLKFLGDINNNKFNDIKKVIKNSAKGKKQDFIQMRGISAFPHIDYPQVMFIKIDRGRKLLESIHDKLDNDFAEYGFNIEDRSYSPHITFARCRRKADLKKLSLKLKKINKEYFVNVFMQCERVSLMKSELKSKGPVYTELYSVSLKK